MCVCVLPNYNTVLQRLQTDVTKVIRYSRKLPEKEASLVKVYIVRLYPVGVPCS